MPDDLTLLDRWRAGDKQAGDALVRAYYREINERFRRQIGGDADLAADLTQQVFEAVVGGRGERPENFRRYLHGIAGFKLVDHLRRRSVRGGRLEPEISRLMDPGHGVFSVLARKDDAHLLVEALQTLTVEEQAYLMWFYADRLTQPEIAERVGLTTSQVNGRIHRARDKLRLQLAVLSQSPEQRGAIDRGFDTWMESLRRRVDAPEPT